MLNYLIGLVLTVYMWVLIARMVLSWVQVMAPQWRPTGVLLVLANAVYTLTDPPLRLLGRVLKPVRIGNIALDMAFTALFAIVLILQWANLMFVPV